MLDSLEELGAKVENQRYYLMALSVKYDYKMSDKEKIDTLVGMLKHAHL